MFPDIRMCEQGSMQFTASNIWTGKSRIKTVKASTVSPDNSLSYVIVIYYAK